MHHEDKQSAVQRLASTLSRVSVEAVRKELENTMIVRASEARIKPVPLKVRLQQCGPAEASEFRTALGFYIVAHSTDDYERKVSARARLEKASRCLLLDDTSNVDERLTAVRQETFVDRLQDGLWGAEFTARLTPKSNLR